MHQLTRPALAFFKTKTALRGTATDGSLKDVELEVSQRMAFKVFTARDPRQRQRIAASMFWIAHVPPGVTRLGCSRRAMGVFRKCRRESAVPSGTDVDRLPRHVRKVPTTDSRCAANKFHHSITSSARAKKIGGIVNPSALAVIRLMTSSTLVLSWIGKSAGLAPLRIFAT
jgi:hypothetical protein